MWPEPVLLHTIAANRAMLGATGGAGTGALGSEAQPGANDHHPGRDAALVGGAGAAGVGAYEAEKNRRGAGQPPIATTTDTVPRQAGTTDFVREAEPSHHDGRDAALVGGAGAAGIGAGAAGVGAYEAEKSRAGAGQRPIATTTNTVPRQTGTTDVRREAEPSHHDGRDAALVGGAGAAGAGAYEAEKSRRGAGEHPVATTTNTVPQQTTTDTVPRQTGTTDVRREAEPSHRDGRDAALAGGAGAAGLGAYEASKEHSAGASAADPYAHSRGPTAPGKSPFPGPSSSPRSSTQQDVREASQPYHHHGRDAAMTGGAAAAGVAGYEALQDRDQPAKSLDTQSAERRHGPTGDKPTVTTREPVDASGKPVRTTDQPVGPITSALPVAAAADGARRNNRDHPTTGAESVQVAPEAFASPPTARPPETHDFGRDPAAAAAADAGRRHAAPEDGKHHNRLEKSPRQIEKHERDLEKAREKEAAIGGDRGHKDGLLSRIIHPGRRSGENPRANEPSRASEEYSRSGELDRKSGDVSGRFGEVNEPRTGPPMDSGKGDGRGGTDRAPMTSGGVREPLSAATTADRGDSVVNEPHTGLPM